MSWAMLYPTPTKEALAAAWVGKCIGDVPTPAAIVNLAAVRRNCARMLRTCDALGLAWRAHVKTHKTVELAHLQVGDEDTRPVHLVVSTPAEAEFLLPALVADRDRGRPVNLLYGLPLTRGAVDRLAAVARALGPASLSVLLDDPAQLVAAAALHDQSGIVPQALVKLDMGGRRAGVEFGSLAFEVVVDAALAAARAGRLRIAGLYSHAGHSYGGADRATALRMLCAEMRALLAGADALRARAGAAGEALPPLTLSAGASPTALAVQNMAGTGADGDGDGADAGICTETEALAAVLAAIEARGHVTEIHAGVYPLLDLQQLAAHSLPSSRLSWTDLALTILAEVHSLYPGRGHSAPASGPASSTSRPCATAEALIGAGVLALGREPCKAYEGMAMATPWGRPGAALPTVDVERFRGWIVGRFSQEHGILTWRSGDEDGPPPEQESDFEVGQKVRLWPNHACIASSHFGWYLVVDEDRVGREDEIVDVWVRARGW